MKKLLDSVKEYYLLIISIFIVISLVIIYTHNSFIDKPVQNKKLYITSEVELKSPEFNEDNQIELGPNQQKSIEITVKNNFNTDKKYIAWYKKLNESSNIEINIENSNQITLSKEGNFIEKNSNYQMIININNKSNIEAKIQFGVVYTDIKELLTVPNNSFPLFHSVKEKNTKEYSIGDKIVLNDKSSWHVIKESLINDDYITLLKDNPINLNTNVQSFNIVSNKVLFQPDDENIKFYLENTYKENLEKNDINIGDDGEIRLITLNELLSIGNYNYKDYNYYGTTIPKWLDINTPWWTMTPFSSESIYYAHKGNIYFAKDNKTTRATIRPVIKVLKTNIEA